jgi:hypothetical protein
LIHFFFYLKILSNLKSKLETISQTFNDFNSLVQLAHEALYQRENTVKVNLLTLVFMFENYFLLLGIG